MERKKRFLPGLGLVLAASWWAGCLLDLGWDSEIQYNSFQESQPVQETSRLEGEIEMSVGNLEVEPGLPDQLYSLEVTYNEAGFEPRTRLTRSGTTARLHFELGTKGYSIGRSGKNRVSLRLSPRVPLELHARTGVGESRLDLSGLRVDSLKLETGVGETRLQVLSPNPISCRRVDVKSGVGSLQMLGLGNLGFEELEFHGGVGGAELDFSGEWPRDARVEINVGVGGVEIALPQDLGVEIDFNRSPLSGVTLTGFRKDGDRYRSENFSQARRTVRFRIRAGIGGVEVRWL